MKEYILSLDQIKLFSILLNISEDDINDSIRYKVKLNSPFHTDKDPSLSFKFFGSRLICNDFGSHVRGDIFDVTGYVLNLNSRDKEDFRSICSHIINVLDNSKTSAFSKVIEDDTPTEVSITTIDFIPRSFDLNDYKFFYNYFIPIEIVDISYIAVKRYFINDRLSKYRHCKEDPCYAYYNNPNSVKLYFPFRDKKMKRFISNNRIPLELIHKLVVKDYTILIKGYKDKTLMDYICLYLKIDNIQFIPLASETAILDDILVKFINSKTLKRVFTMFDIDKTGIESSRYYEEHYGYTPLVLSTVAKDPTDVITKVKFQKFIHLFQNLNKKIQNG